MDYYLNTAFDLEAQRLKYLEEISDPGSRRLLACTGVDVGWSCLEVGAGAGSIAAWLADVVGSAGSVVATDICTANLDWLGGKVTVVAHDVAREPLPLAAFDLVHCRFVVEHLSDWSLAVNNIASAVKPGGWLVLECHDHSTAYLDSMGSDGMQTISDSILEIFHREGADFYLGRKLPDIAGSIGLESFSIDARTSAIRFGSAQSRSLLLLVQHLELNHRRLGSSAFSDDVIRDLSSRVAAGPGHFFSPLVVSIVGQKAA